MYSLQEELIAAEERCMLSQAHVNDLQEQSRCLFESKSSLKDEVQSISAAAASAVTATGVSSVVPASPAVSLSPASRDVAKALKSAVCGLAAAGEAQTQDNRALAAELHITREQLKDASSNVVELTQNVSMWQDLSHTLRDENNDLAARVMFYRFRILRL
jgi:chromosome segregation ATPase